MTQAEIAIFNQLTVKMTRQSDEMLLAIVADGVSPLDAANIIVRIHLATAASICASGCRAIGVPFRPDALVDALREIISQPPVPLAVAEALNERDRSGAPRQ